jgi:hypothetical protein
MESRSHRLIVRKVKREHPSPLIISYLKTFLQIRRKISVIGWAFEPLHLFAVANELRRRTPCNLLIYLEEKCTSDCVQLNICFSLFSLFIQGADCISMKVGKLMDILAHIRKKNLLSLRSSFTSQTIFLISLQVV